MIAELDTVGISIMNKFGIWMVEKRWNDLDAKKSGIQMPFEYPTA